MKKFNNAGEILKEASETFIAKNKEYGDNWRMVGPVMEGLFPHGLMLDTEDEFNRFHILMLLIVKLTRYTTNWHKGHQDSLRDAAVYCSMLEFIDTENEHDEKMDADIDRDIDKMEDEIFKARLKADGISEAQYALWLGMNNFKLGDLKPILQKGESIVPRKVFDKFLGVDKSKLGDEALRIVIPPNVNLDLTTALESIAQQRVLDSKKQHQRSSDSFNKGLDQMV